MNGTGPSPDYMAQLRSTLGGGAPPTGPVMLGGGGGGPAPVPPMEAPPPMPAAPPPVVNAPAAPPPPAAATPFTAGPAPSTYFDAPPPVASPWAGPDPTAALAKGIADDAARPAPPQASAAAGPAPAPAPEHRPFLQQIGGGGVVNQPAHETELRGPQLRIAQEHRNEVTQRAIGEVSNRIAEQVSSDYRIATQQEDEARARQQAATNQAVQQAQEMQKRQADFDQSVKALSQMSVDPSRFWSNANVGQKIAAVISLSLGGFVAARNGGRNPGQEQINNLIDNDIKAQEFAYNAAKDSTNAKQTAFSMAMQKYQNADQARAAARASAIDAVQAQMAQQAALWKGTDAANRATMANSALEDEKTAQIQQGVAYTPARQVAVGAQYRDPRTGLVYSEKEYKHLVETMDANEEKRQEKGLDVAGQLVVQQNKPADAKDNDARTVVLDGTPRLALSKDKAEKWDKYNHARTVFGGALQALKAARADGNVGEYNSARATLIETYPELLGYTRAPTEGQINHTVGPEAIPEYNHWYEPENLLTGGAGYVLKQGRSQEKIDRLNSVMRESDKAMKENTFGETTALPKSLTFHDGAK